MGDKIRIQFSKHGNIRFIGHLDVMRYFQKAVRRAGIDIAYSEGFSPHQIMSFASPLGVGLESDAEYMDIVVNSIAGGEKGMVDALNSVMAEGIRVINARLLPDNAKNAMASIAAAAYFVRFREGFEPDFPYAEKLKEFYALPSIMITKKTKKNEIELDLKPSIYQLYEVDGGIYMLVNASSAGNIKPGTVMEAFYRMNGRELPEFSLHITRREIYTYDGEGESAKLIPLSEVGETFS
ncbi:MAG: TIGR03936 family radical SAM-associated protein [Lachnospiraceae bacterium]|nr:TIGR03936 family radical SAM-associated protein [Lachnospiraceae bacterium]